MSQDKINTRAIEMAQEALTRIDSHEKVCAVRYNGINSTLEEIKEGQKGLYGRFWWAMTGLVVILLTALSGVIAAVYHMINIMVVG
jgi:uncharacterized membrane protein